MATSVLGMETTEREPDLISEAPEAAASEEREEEEEEEEETDAGAFSGAVVAKVAEVRRRVGESVERVLDESPRYRAAVRAAFHQFQKPPAIELPRAHLLPALQFFVQRLSDTLDAKCGKLILRPITHDDILCSTRSNTSLSLHQPFLTLAQFEGFAREAVKRVALERSQRLGVFLVGGVAAVHMAKSALKSLPVVGALVSVLLPTPLVGLAVGIASALHL